MLINANANNANETLVLTGSPCLTKAAQEKERVRQRRSKSYTASDVITGLKNKYKAEDGFITLTELISDNGKRRADCAVINVWKDYRIGFEIKVSRSDWLTEMKTVEKAQEMAKYFHFWNFVSPWEMIAKKEVEEKYPGFGLMWIETHGEDYHTFKTVLKPQRNDHPILTEVFYSNTLKRMHNLHRENLLTEIEHQVMQRLVRKNIAFNQPTNKLHYDDCPWCKHSPKTAILTSHDQDRVAGIAVFCDNEFCKHRREMIVVYGNKAADQQHLAERWNQYCRAAINKERKER